jgi:hypothetical protein
MKVLRILTTPKIGFTVILSQEDWKKDVAAHHFANSYLNSADTRRLMEGQFVALSRALRALGLAK